MKKKIVFTMIALGFMHTLSLAASSPDYTVTYKNIQGSTLILTWHPDKTLSAGTVSGMLTSASSPCKQSSGLPATVNGVFTGNAIAVTVNYPKCDKVFAMTGNVRSGKTELNTSWLIAASNRDYMKDNLAAPQVVTDLFTKVAS